MQKCSNLDQLSFPFTPIKDEKMVAVVYYYFNISINKKVDWLYRNLFRL